MAYGVGIGNVDAKEHLSNWIIAKGNWKATEYYTNGVSFFNPKTNEGLLFVVFPLTGKYLVQAEKDGKAKILYRGRCGLDAKVKLEVYMERN